MLTALDAPSDRLDKHERNFIDKVRQHGWFRTGVTDEPGKLGFSYSTGLWLHDRQPELIMFSVPDDVAHQIFWDVFRDAQAGQSLPIGQPIDSLVIDLPVYAFPIAKQYYPAYLGWSRWFYGGDNFPCVQLVWPDRTGLFPWDSSFDATF